MVVFSLLDVGFEGTNGVKIDCRKATPNNVGGEFVKSASCSREVLKTLWALSVKFVIEHAEQICYDENVGDCFDYRGSVYIDPLYASNVSLPKCD